MPAVTGVAFLIKVNTGTIEAPEWTPVAGQRNATLNRSTDEADVTNKMSDGWYEGIPTFNNWSIDFDGLVIESDASYQYLEDAYMTKEVFDIEMVTPGGNMYTGKGYFTDFTIEAPYDDAATYSGTIQGTGALIKTTTP